MKQSFQGEKTKSIKKAIDRVDYYGASFPSKMRQWVELSLYASKQKLSMDRNMQELT